jgi:nitroimidazol reductase NimA-like FMN-containing flavoprotein (pyridoxamine 5'-phosphate oxidase superfamily)
MFIEEINRNESIELLGQVRLGRLACAQNGQPYIVPFYFVYREGFLYSFTAVGQKIHWMRANPLVCVEVDDIANPLEWSSVVIFGSYEELPDIAVTRFHREFAWKLLRQYPMWWEPALANSSIGNSGVPREPLFYRIRISRITGRRAKRRPDTQSV